MVIGTRTVLPALVLGRGGAADQLLGIHYLRRHDFSTSDGTTRTIHHVSTVGLKVTTFFEAIVTRRSKRGIPCWVGLLSVYRWKSLYVVVLLLIECSLSGAFTGTVPAIIIIITSQEWSELSNTSRRFSFITK